MQKEQINKIIEEFVKHDHSPELRRKFELWLSDTSDAAEKEQTLQELWNAIHAQADNSTFAEFQLLKQKIQQPPLRKNRQAFYMRFARIAAVLIIPIVCSVLTYHIARKQVVSEIAYVECFVENGERKQVVLADGTEVWINSGSYLIYPENFIGNIRQVFLTGEANFLVAHDPKKPFQVNTNNLVVEALGTTFNVQAYTDMFKTIATLEEGKIRVETRTKHPESFILNPNEQIEYSSKTRKATRKMVDAQRVASWKDGYLIFQNATLDEVLHGICKRFDVVAQFDSGKYAGRTFTVRFTPDQSLQETLNIMQEIIKDFEYTIKENTIFIY